MVGIRARSRTARLDLPSQSPYSSFEDFATWINAVSTSTDPLFFAICDRERRATGVASYLRIVPEQGSIEVGHIHLSPPLQRTPAATEAMYLMMKYAFELGYRRYEWKCDALNAPSRAAAERLGFTFEGIFRQALVYKDRNRDTAWYRSSTRNGPTAALHSSSGYLQKTSMMMDANAVG